MAAREPTVLRHAGGVRLAHLTFALLIGVLILSGLGVEESLPTQVASIFGGHVVLATLHHLFGHALELVLLLALYFMLARVRGLLSAVVRFDRFEAAWPLAFLRFLLHPHKNPPPWHNGRFDPVQRLVFLLLGGSLLLVVVTGLAFNFIPSNSPMLFAWNLRIHITAAMVLISTAGVHVVVGSGLLFSHRGVARTMFGDGRVRMSVGRRLWPGWTARQVEAESTVEHPELYG